MPKDETRLFRQKLRSRRESFQEMEQGVHAQNKHGVWPAEVDEALIDCEEDLQLAWRPKGASDGGMDLWYVLAPTWAGRLLYIMGRMGGDGQFRLITARCPYEKPNDRKWIDLYRQMRPDAES
jgi:hypothetical protein